MSLLQLLLLLVVVTLYWTRTLFDVLDDHESLAGGESTHADVVLRARTSRQGVDGRRVTQHLVLRHWNKHTFEYNE